MTLFTPHPTNQPKKLTVSKSQQYLSYYLPDFYQTLKEGSWEHLERIPTVKMTFVQATFALEHLAISGLSQLLLTRFEPNFNGKVKAM